MFKTKFKIELLHDEMYHVFEMKWFQIAWQSTLLPGFFEYKEAQDWVAQRIAKGKK